MSGRDFPHAVQGILQLKKESRGAEEHRCHAQHLAQGRALGGGRLKDLLHRVPGVPADQGLKLADDPAAHDLDTKHEPGRGRDDRQHGRERKKSVEGERRALRHGVVLVPFRRCLRQDLPPRAEAEELDRGSLRRAVGGHRRG